MKNYCVFELYQMAHGISGAIVRFKLGGVCSYRKHLCLDGISEWASGRRADRCHGRGIGGGRHSGIGGRDCWIGGNELGEPPGDYGFDVTCGQAPLRGGRAL